MATSLEQIILFRVLQGLAGGGLQPSSQGVLLDSFPPEKQGAAMTLFGMAALIGPVVGPTLGGYLTDNYNWRWIFYINIPIGAVAFLGSYFLLEDPDYLKQAAGGAGQQAAQLRHHRPGPVGHLPVVLGSGAQQRAAVGLVWRPVLAGADAGDRVRPARSALLVFRELRIANPVVNFRPLAERNLAMSSIIIFCAYGVLYAASTSLPGLLQSLFGYDAFSSGLVMSPSGIGSICMLIVGGALLGRGVDARWMIAVGPGHLRDRQLLDGADESGNQPLASRLAAGGADRGLGLLFAPVNVAAYMYTPRHLRGAAVGLFSLLRNEGGSVGTSMAQTFQERRDQFHTLRVGEFLDPFNPDVSTLSRAGPGFFLQANGRSGSLATNGLAVARGPARVSRPSSLAYFDIFTAAAALSVVLVLLVFFMKRSVAEKGAHLAAE